MNTITTETIEMVDEGGISDTSSDFDSRPSSPDGEGDGNLLTEAMENEVTAQLVNAGVVGIAAAAAITSSKKRKRPHSFETNPSIRKRQQNRLLRKLRQTIFEYATRVGQQAVVLVATPGKPNNIYKVFGAKPLEDVIKNLRTMVMDELESALAQQAPPKVQEDPSLFELPPLIIDGIPTPVEKMTQAQLRAFIPLMLKYSTGRGKPGWGRDSTRPEWWPKELPWANVRMDARTEEEKQKISWTHALRKIVINCYKYHGREDLLPAFSEEDEKANAIATANANVGVLKIHNHSATSNTNHTGTTTIVTTTSNSTHAAQSSNTNHTVLPKIEVPAPQTIQIQSSQSTANTTQVCIDTMPLSDVDYQTVLQTNADGTFSLIQVDPSTLSNNPSIITLPDGTTAQVQGVATLHTQSDGTVHTVQTIDGQTENMQVDLSEALAQDGQFIITNEDGNVFPVAVSGMITLPVTAQMYHSLVQQQIPNSDNTVCVTPMQVQNLIANNSLCCSNSISNVNPTTYLMSSNNSSRNYVNLPIQSANCQTKATNQPSIKSRTVKKSTIKKKILTMTAQKLKPKSLVISKNDNNNCKDIKDKNDEKSIQNGNFKNSHKKYESKGVRMKKQSDESRLSKKQNAFDGKQE
ncbi:DNA-binding protein Ewg isoform X2 [Chironomus tepperi]|uniref:DNA-binding protein Ewg isoform X2 n=1 Tax=Chironomus tepperi TaxID=113505 RepID=UPI00391EE1F6